MFDEKYIREYAMRYSFTIRRGGGKVKLSDYEGNEIVCQSMQDALSAMQVYQTEPLTSPIYEIGEAASKVRIRIAAPNGPVAKRMYKSKMRMSAPDTPLTAKKIK